MQELTFALTKPTSGEWCTTQDGHFPSENMLNKVEIADGGD
jgi:hypothetical protein